MKIYSRKFFALALSCALVFNLAGCATAYKTHPEFKERHLNIRSASLMPPEVDAYVLTFQGDKKRLHDIIPIMEKTTLEELEKILAEKGYAIKPLDLSESALEKNPELRTSLFNVRKLFNKSLEDIAKRRQKKFTYSVGSEVNVFADLADCDILIFVKEDGAKKSAGEVAKDVAKGAVMSAAFLLIGVIYVPIPQLYATLVHIAIVDSNDGAILWYHNNAMNVSVDPGNQKAMAQLVRSLIRPFPDSAFKKKDSKKAKVKPTKKAKQEEQAEEIKQPEAAPEAMPKAETVTPVSTRPRSVYDVKVPLQ